MIRTGILRHSLTRFLTSIALAVLLLLCVIAATGNSGIPELEGRIVAAGIPGVAAVAAVGTFHEGGPIHDNSAFRAFTAAGAVLDSNRVLVSSTSNFGAPVGHSEAPTGSILSIDPRSGTPVRIPATFAASGNQATALDGRVILYTANSPGFMNHVYNPAAATAKLPSVTNPTAISINNGFGRIWVTGEPFGAKGAGVQSVLDPDGCPLNHAPNKVAGGVFSGSTTNRSPQLIEGSMSTAALATALLGKSPDGSGRAVFAGLNADGSVVQVHVEQGVDGLAPAGTVRTLQNHGQAARGGMVFNWVPNPILYVTDPMGNSLVALSLRADAKLFQVEGARRLSAPELNVPIDLAPAIAEVANPSFSSNTTLAGDSDIYVANRGNGTIVRLTQNGTVVGVRKIKVPGVGLIGAGRLNGIAISPDAQHIWVTLTGSLPGYSEGAVLELPVFGGVEPSAAR
jgi:hypothetical protein